MPAAARWPPSFALLAGFHWRGTTTAGAWASVIVGLAWGVGTFVVVGEAGGYTWPWAMYGIPLIAATGALVSLFDRRSSAPPELSSRLRATGPAGSSRGSGGSR